MSPVAGRLRYFLHRDADLPGAALRLFLRAVEQCLRAQIAGAGSTTRLGAVVCIHRFGSTLNAHLHFHAVVIGGVSDAATTSGIVFHATTGIDANAIAQVQAGVRRRLARAASCSVACCRAMTRGRWGNGNTAAASPCTARCASRPPTAPGVSGGCATLARPPFALDRLRELDLERVLYAGTKPGPGGNARLLLTPLELLDRLPHTQARAIEMPVALEMPVLKTRPEFEPNA